MLRIVSGTVDQKVSFRRIPGLALGNFIVYRSRNGATAVAYTTPTITEDSLVPGMYHFTMDEDMSLDPGHVTEQMLFSVVHPDIPTQPYEYEVELFISSPIRKNQAFANFPFVMISSTDHFTPLAGLAVTAERSIDGGAFAACANSVVAISNGAYKINLAATDLDGDSILFRFTATGADARMVTVIPSRA